MNEKRSAYTQTRYNLDQKRTLVWKVFAPYLQKKFHIQGHILDVGCGFGDFINNVQSSTKAALDANEEMKQFLNPGIDFKPGLTSDLKSSFQSQSFDWIFSSNLLEHLTRDQVTAFFNDSKDLLKENGSLLIFMPNYRFCSSEYFDDYTHLTPISDRSINDWLKACGYKVEFIHPRFMPYSVKDSRLPIMSWLVKLWLISPFKPGKQMLIHAIKA